jgi:hypothetical protein
MKLYEIINTKTKSKFTTLPVIDSMLDQDASNLTTSNQPMKSLGLVASKNVTSQKVSNIVPSQKATTALSSLMANSLNNDQDDSEVPEPPTKPTNLPAVLSRGMMASGMVSPEWHTIQNLPGYMQQPIRQLGKSVFSMYTSTPIEKIQLIANLGGQGPNTNREINAVANWVMDQGKQITTGNINFDNIMPGYEADIKVFDMNNGAQILVVKDEYGRYLYAWPSSDSKLTSNNKALK